jgi:aminodeoxyfutalosine deaminase
MTLASYLRAAPKVELHIHLEGAIRPTTVRELAARNGVDLPELANGVGDRFAYRDFGHFVELFVAAVRSLQTVDDYERIVVEFAADLAGQHVRYAEVTFSPSTHFIYGVQRETYFEGLQRGRERARAEYGVELAWIFNLVRRWNDPTRLRPLADYATSVAVEGREIGVVALGLGGAEPGAPPEPFAPWFDRALAAGLHSAPHAVELAGPESVWGALRALGTERIGHGVRAIDDPALVAELAQRRIALEVCPTSNICLGVYPTYAAHPLARLHAAGVPVTVNSDDPPLFGTTLNDEVTLLAEPFGLDVAACDELLLNAVHHSFLSPARKAALLADFQAELAALKPLHLVN